jgi:hypothetical protein
MRNWVEEIASEPDNFALVLEAYEYYCDHYEIVSNETKLEHFSGDSVWDISLKTPGLAEHVHARWSEINAISDHLELLILSATQTARKHYIEGYNRVLGSHQVSDYAQADPSVISLRQLLLRIKLIQNKWEGVSKALERLHFQLRNLIELEKAGVRDLRI